MTQFGDRAKGGRLPAQVHQAPQGTGRAVDRAAVDRAAARGPDLRLAGAALGAWLATLAVLGAGPREAVITAGLGATIAAGAWAVGRRRRGRPSTTANSARFTAVHPARFTAAYIVAALAVGAASGAACCALQLVTRDSGPLATLADERSAVTLELLIRDDPRQVRGGPVGRGSYVVAADLERVTHRGEHRAAGGRVLVLAADAAWRDLLPGQRVRAQGRLAPPRGGDLTAAVLSARGGPQRMGEPPWLQRAAGTLRAGLQRACADLPDKEGGLLPGLVVGDTSRMDPALEEAFRATGMTHLTAVSGSNVAVICGLVLLLARLCRAGPRTAAALAGLALVGFVILARPSPSVLRAAVMGAIALVALAASRPRAAVPALGATVFVLVLGDPALARAPGFALSVLATAGLLMIAPGWRDALRGRGVPAGFAEALAVPAAAQAACAPVIAAMVGVVSLSAIPANLLAVPAVAPATILGVLAAVTSPLSPSLAELFAWLGSWPARWLVEIAEHGAAVPGGALPWPGGVGGGLLLATALAALLALGRWPAARRVLLAVIAAVALVALPVRILAPGWPPADWAVVACDVGQGDALAVRAGPGAAVVIDAGPDPALIDRCLRRLGIAAVPLLVLSHPHADHVGGLAGVLRGRTVGAIAIGPATEPPSGRGLVAREASAHRVRVLTPGPGWSATIGAAHVQVLGPPREFVGTRSDANNNSLVVRAQVAGVSVLLCGDAENAAQQSLLDAGVSLRSDVLKVAHHGSAYSETAFLDAVDPAVALVQVGVGNGYGHPNAGVVAHLRRTGARVLRTDQDGDLAVIATSSELAIAIRGHEIDGPDP